MSTLMLWKTVFLPPLAVDQVQRTWERLFVANGLRLVAHDQAITTNLPWPDLRRLLRTAGVRRPHRRRIRTSARPPWATWTAESSLTEAALRLGALAATLARPGAAVSGASPSLPVVVDGWHRVRAAATGGAAVVTVDQTGGEYAVPDAPQAAPHAPSAADGPD